MSTWLIRGGRQGQHEQFCLDNGLVGAGWHEVPDLTDAKDWDSLKAIVEAVYPGNPGAVPNYTGQLWRLRHDIKPGDTVVLPLKTTSQIAIGKAKGSYSYDASADLYRRHQIPVEWMVTDIPRTAVKRDLLFSMGSAMTVCALSRNDADWRVEQLALTGVDPGARPEAVGVPGTTEATAGEASGGGEAEDEIAASGVLDVERYALDRLTQVVGERFAGYEMQELVAAILRADGYHAEVPPEGADGGIDVVAGAITASESTIAQEISDAQTAIEAEIQANAITPDDVWEHKTSSISVSSSIGARLKNAATVATTGEQIAAFEN